MERKNHFPDSNTLVYFILKCEKSDEEKSDRNGIKFFFHLFYSLIDLPVAIFKKRFFFFSFHKYSVVSKLICHYWFWLWCELLRKLAESYCFYENEKRRMNDRNLIEKLSSNERNKNKFSCCFWWEKWAWKQQVVSRVMRV